jgi:hypothetical protein
MVKPIICDSTWFMRILNVGAFGGQVRLNTKAPENKPPKRHPFSSLFLAEIDTRLPKLLKVIFGLVYTFRHNRNPNVFGCQVSE